MHMDKDIFQVSCQNIENIRVFVRVLISVCADVKTSFIISFTEKKIISISEYISCV